MRIATWNVNSLKERLDKVVWWLDRAKPDVLLMQETKLTDADAPVEAFQRAGYEFAHHGEGRWNGVAIASRVGIAEVISNFGQPLRAPATPDVPDDEPLAEARMISAVCGGVRVVSLYAPNGRALDSPFYRAKLAWFDRLARWLVEARDPGELMALGGDYNVAPADADVWDPVACHGGTHVSEPERLAFTRLCHWGLIDAYRLHRPEPGRYTWWDYRAGNFHKNFGMRIDHLLATRPVAGRTVWAEIDREARKGKPIPSDHAPLVIDLDEAGFPIEPPIEPMLAKLATALPAGDGWLFEPKWDGFRAIVFRDRDRFYLQSRDLRPLDRYFPELEAAFRSSLPARCVVDGEIVIATERGLDFDALQMRLHPAASRVKKLAVETPAAFAAFDLLAGDGRDLRSRPQAERRLLLERAFRRASGRVHLTPCSRERSVA